jgi:hypothetical protein
MTIRGGRGYKVHREPSQLDHSEVKSSKLEEVMAGIELGFEF